MAKLTDAHVRSALGKRHDKKSILPDGDGLVLVCVGQSCTWQLRYMIDGKARTLGLGSAKLISLADARNKSLAERKAVRVDGVDVVAVSGPRALRKARAAKAEAERVAAAQESAKTKSFREACDGYLADHARKWTDRRAESSWRSSMKWANDLIGDVPIAAVGKAEVLTVLKQTVDGNPFAVAKPEQFRRVAARTRDVLDWAVACDFREKGVNPADPREIGAALPKVSRKTKHRAAMPAEDCPALWSTLAADETTPKVKALMFSLLTAARAGEVLQATWSEFDLEAAVWTIPAEHFKGRRSVRVPLCKAAVALLKALPGNREPKAAVFPKGNGKPYAETIDLNDTMKAFAPGWDQHGTARSTLRDWAAKRGARHEVCEALIDHLVGDSTVQAYARTDWFDERLEVFEAWAKHLGAKAESPALAA